MPGSDRLDGAFETNTPAGNSPLPSEIPSTVGLPPRVRETAVTYPYEVEGESWLGTLGFLLGLVLFGIIVGYMLRGGNAQGSEVAVAMPSPLTAVSTLGEQDATARASKVSIMTEFGSDAPDELLALNVLSDGESLAGLVRMHNTRANAPDRVSFVQVSPSGDVSETRLSDSFDLKQAAIAELGDDRFITASVSSSELTLQTLNARGKTDWVRNFPVAQSHAARVEVKGLPSGAIAIGPGEKVERVGLIHIGMDGDLVWQRSFAADPVSPDIHVAAGPDGAVFVAVRELASTDGASHALMRIEADGQMSWKMPLEIGRLNKITDFNYSSDEAVVLISNGLRPQLKKVSQDGALLWQQDLTGTNGQEQLHLILDKTGGSITAQPYSMMGENLYVSLQKWSPDGLLVADGDLALPTKSSLDAMAMTETGALILAGSVQPDRFEDADVFIHQAIMTRNDWLPRTIRPIEPETSVIAEQNAEASVIPVSAVPVEEIQEPEVAVAPVEPVEESLEEVIEVAVTPVEPSVSEPVLTAGLEMPWTSEDTEAEDGVEPGFVIATSSAVAAFTPAEFWDLAPDRTAIAQCRFTCLDEGGIETFPMWTSVEATGADFLTGLTDVHSNVCGAARGTSLQSVQPDCKLMN